MDNVKIVQLCESFDVLYDTLATQAIYSKENQLIRLIGFDCEMITDNQECNKEIYETYIKNHPEVKPYNNIIICKIIIYTNDFCVIVDLSETKAMPIKLIEILKNDSWIKTGVGIANDFIILSENYSLGILVGEIEIKNIALMCGINKPNLLEIYRSLTNDNTLNKTKSSSDWSGDMTLSQIIYAKNDGYMSYIIGKKIFNMICPVIKNAFTQASNSVCDAFSFSSEDIDYSLKNELTQSRESIHDGPLTPPLDISIESSSVNYVGKLQEYAQHNNIELPIYKEIQTLNNTFTIQCNFINEQTIGIGKCKKDAKKEAARIMLEKIT